MPFSISLCHSVAISCLAFSALLTCYLCLSLRTQIRNTSLPPMASNSGYMATDMFGQQATQQIHLNCYGARMADYPEVAADPSPMQDRHGRRMAFDSTPANSSVLLPWESYPHGSVLTPESFSATSPPLAARSNTRPIHCAPQSGGVTSSPDNTKVNVRKERRRAQNRIAQRGGQLLLPLKSIVS